MTLNLNFNCCENMRDIVFKKPACCSQNHSEDNLRGLVYTANGIESFTLLQTPFVEVKDFVLTEDIPFHTVTVFYKDKNDDIRIVLHHEPHDPAHRISHHRHSPQDAASEETDDTDDDSKLTTTECNRARCEIHQGRLAKELLPQHLRGPLIKFMMDTLDGTYYQLQGLFNASSKMIRTFPIIDHNDRILSGMMIIGAVSLFEVDSDNVKDGDHSPAGPESQSMVASIPSTRHMGKHRKKLTWNRQDKTL